MVQLFGGEIAGEAGDGLTAIAEYSRTKPDVVLMDITMPQMEGIEAVERIVRQHPEARIVMVSSVGYQENILAALQKRCQTFCPETREAGSALRNSSLRLERRFPRLPGLPLRSPGSTAHENGFNPGRSLTPPTRFFAESLQGPTKIGDLLMEESAYHRKGVAALIVIKGDIEGRIILDLETDVALKVAAILTGAEVVDNETNRSRNGLRNWPTWSSEIPLRLLNDQGYRFKVFPPGNSHERPGAWQGFARH